MTGEKRSSDRIPFIQEVVVYAQGRRLSCWSTDLGVGGICLIPPAKAKPGLHIIVDMGLEGGQSVAIEGFVVREGETSSRYAWGVRFQNVPPRVQRMLAAYVARERAENPPPPPPPRELPEPPRRAEPPPPVRRSKPDIIERLNTTELRESEAIAAEDLDRELERELAKLYEQALDEVGDPLDPPKR